MYWNTCQRSVVKDFILTYIKGLTAKRSCGADSNAATYGGKSFVFGAPVFKEGICPEMDYYIPLCRFLSINLVTCFYNRDFTKHYDTKIVIID